MPMTETQRELQRRKRRRRKLKELKRKLAEATDLKTRNRFQVKIQKIDPFSTARDEPV
jgi:ribosomal protein L18E